MIRPVARALLLLFAVFAAATIPIASAVNCEVDTDCYYALPGTLCCLGECVATECCDDTYCDDGIPCTLDSCSETTCVHYADDSLCTSGDYGTCGYATCVALVGCVPMPDVARCAPPIECEFVDCVEIPCNVTSGDVCDPPELHSRFDCVYSPDPACVVSSSVPTSSVTSSSSSVPISESSSVPFDSSSLPTSSSSVPISESSSVPFDSSSLPTTSSSSETPSCIISSDCPTYPGRCENYSTYCMDTTCSHMDPEDLTCCETDEDCYSACGSVHCDLDAKICVIDEYVGTYSFCCRNDTECEDDGDECTLEYCSSVGYCSYYITPGYECCRAYDCYDGDACTTDVCDVASHSCRYEPIEPCCRSDAECDDGKTCTYDTCLSGSCYNYESCYDGKDCTLDHCDNVTGDCAHDQISCDDADPCTRDYCTETGFGYWCHNDDVECPDSPTCEFGCDVTCRSLDFLFGGMNYGLAACGSGSSCVTDHAFWPYIGASWTLVPRDDPTSSVLTWQFIDYSKNCIETSECTAIPYPTTVNCTHAPSAADEVCIYTVDVDYGNCAVVYVDHFSGELVVDNACQVDPWQGYFCQYPSCVHYGLDDPFGTCVFRKKTCDDGDECTIDCCDESTDSCNHTAIPDCGVECSSDAECDDGAFCTVDSCNATGACVHSPVVAFECCESSDAECDDGLACTLDTCDAASHVCSHDPIPECCESDAECDDGSACTSDTCDLATHACANDPIPDCCELDSECDDGSFCTSDTCDIATHTCLHDPIPDCCELDSECDDGSSCTSDSCDLATHACLHDPIPDCCELDSECDDGSVCTSNVCDLSSHSCRYDPISGCCELDSECDDYSVCTSDYCDLSTHSCAHDPIPECCESDVDCDDGILCTADSCDLSTHACAHDPIPECCETGADCPPFPPESDACVGDPECVSGECIYPPIEGCCNPLHPCSLDGIACYEFANCTSTSDDVAGHCLYWDPIPGCCAVDSDCEDGNLCTADYCSSYTHSCGSVPELCYDGNDCTTDYCTDDECRHDWIPECCYLDSQCADADACSVDFCRQPGEEILPHEITHVYV